jgi:hypothetical protein
MRQIVYATTGRHIDRIEMNLLVVRRDRSMLMLAIPPAVEAEQNAVSGSPRQSVHFECR